MRRPGAHISILAALLLLAASARPASAAKVLDRYDVDSLVALAELIVRGEVGDATEVRTRDGDCTVAEIKVLSTLKGKSEPRSVLRVAGLEAYRKGPGIAGAGKRFPRLSKGDVVYLFLVPRDAPMGYAMYRLTDADWKIIESGARLVVEDRVYAFGQYFPRGPGRSVGPVPGFVVMTEKTFPRAPVQSVATFEQHVARSIEFVAELKRKLADGSLSAAERRAILKARAAVLKKELARTDHIPRLLADEARPAKRP